MNIFNCFLEHAPKDWFENQLCRDQTNGFRKCTNENSEYSNKNVTEYKYLKPHNNILEKKGEILGKKSLGEYNSPGQPLESSAVLNKQLHETQRT